VVGPQLEANWRAGYGLRLAANTWWNLELGLTTSGGEAVGVVNNRYWASSSDRLERERMAEERTRAYLAKTGWGTALVRQFPKLWKTLVSRDSSFERSLDRMQRWGPTPPGWLRAQELPGRLLWYAILVSGLVGAVALARRDLPWTMLALFVLGFLGILLLVPLKVRFALPLVPVLCVFGAGWIEGLMTRSERRERQLGT